MVCDRIMQPDRTFRSANINNLRFVVDATHPLLSGTLRAPPGANRRALQALQLLRCGAPPPHLTVAEGHLKGSVATATKGPEGPGFCVTLTSRPAPYGG